MAAQPPPRPPIDTSEPDVETHYYFHGHETRCGHRIHAGDSPLTLSPSLPARDWRLSLTATFLNNSSDVRPYFLRDLPARLLPFFAYKDVALYVPMTDGLSSDLGTLFDEMYREWYPTRDRTVFHDGLFKGCGGPFFSSTMRINFEKPAPQPPALLSHLVRWHVALSRHLHSLLPDFGFLQRSLSMLVHPGLMQPPVQVLPNHPLRSLPNFPYIVEYTPVMRRTFAECFVWAGPEWKDKGLRLVVLGGDMLRRILSGECEGLRRDVEMDELATETTSSGRDNENERRVGEQDKHMGLDAEISVDHVSVWRGSLKDVMRAVVAGDEGRKTGRIEYNFMLEEWLGEGEYVRI